MQSNQGSPSDYLNIPSPEFYFIKNATGATIYFEIKELKNNSALETLSIYDSKHKITNYPKNKN